MDKEELASNIINDAITRSANGLDADSLLFIVNATVHVKLLNAMIEQVISGKINCIFNGDDDEPASLDDFEFIEREAKVLQ